MLRQSNHFFKALFFHDTARSPCKLVYNLLVSVWYVRHWYIILILKIDFRLAVFWCCILTHILYTQLAGATSLFNLPSCFFNRTKCGLNVLLIENHEGHVALSLWIDAYAEHSIIHIRERVNFCCLSFWPGGAGLVYVECACGQVTRNQRYWLCKYNPFFLNIMIKVWIVWSTSLFISFQKYFNPSSESNIVPEFT